MLKIYEGEKKPSGPSNYANNFLRCYVKGFVYIWLLCNKDCFLQDISRLFYEIFLQDIFQDVLLRLFLPRFSESFKIF